jgi:hypothetical protein
MASFQKLLAEKREDNLGESDRVAIAEAGVQYSSDVQGRIDREYKNEPSKDPTITKSKFENISSPVRGLPEDLRSDVSQLEDGSYQDLIKFIRKYERVRNEVGDKKSFYNEDESDYVENTIAPVLLKIAELKGPVARAAFAFEDFKSQFKPLKLADRFLGDLPIIGNMIRERLDAKSEADKLARTTGLRARKEKLKQGRKKGKSSGGNISFGADTSSNLAPPMQEMTSSPIVSKSSGGMFGGSEESQKEQANRDEEQTNLFELIAENTLETKYLLGELLEAYKNENEGMGELLDTGTSLAAGAGGAVAGGAGLLGAKSLFGRTKQMIKGGKDKVKNMTKGAGKAAGKFGKAALRGLKFIPGLGLVAVGGMGLYDGVKGFNADKDAGFGEKLGNAGSSVLSGLTFGMLGQSADEIAAEDQLSGGDLSQALDTSANGVNKSKSQSVGLGQVFEINAEKVMLKANSMKQLQNENEIIRRDMATGQNGAVNNSVTSQVINNAKSTFMGPRLTSTNPRNVVKSIF